jgi:TRAP-type C4-dicarboxylate transport system substrate-binding protein
MIKALEEAGKGRLKITEYPSQTLCKAAETYDATVSGITDIGMHYLGYTPGKFALSEVINLPMMGFKTASEAAGTIWKLYSETDLIKDEFKDIHVLTFIVTDPSKITTNFVLTTKADFAGKNLRVPGGPSAQFYKALGASVIAMPGPDIYQALEKNVIDGLDGLWEMQDNNNLQEVVKYGYDVNISCALWVVGMNKAKWDSLPADIQEIFNQQFGEKGAMLISSNVWDKNNPQIVEKFKKAGVEISTIAPEELATWKVVADETNAKWASDLDAKGLKGTETLNKAREILQAIQAK